MKIVIPNLLNGLISLCCNTNKNNPIPPKECDPYKDDPFAIANFNPNINIDNEKINKDDTAKLVD